MAEKDKVQKTLESYNDVFADIVNVLLFNGRRVVDENDLTDAQTFSYYKINVFELAWLTDEQINSFTSDFRYVAILLRRIRTGRPYPMTDPKYTHAREILDLFRVMSQNNKEAGIILDDINNAHKQTGGNHMTEEEFDEMINRFEDRGAQKKAIEDAMELLKENISPEIIAKCVKLPLEQVLELQKQIKVPAQA